MTIAKWTNQFEYKTPSFHIVIGVFNTCNFFSVFVGGLPGKFLYVPARCNEAMDGDALHTATQTT